MPGAQLDEIEGDVYRGRVKVKLGPVNAQFKGQATFVERNDDDHTAKLHASGRDTGGRGNAEADISAAAEALSPTSTKCTVVADVHITGRVAQFGRNVMSDVSKKLIDQFANNLNTMLDEQGAPEPAAEPTADADAAPAAATDDTASDEAPRVRKIEGPAAEPVDLASFGPTMVKQLAPVVAVVLLLLLILRRRS
jgi:hypothetical protein